MTMLTPASSRTRHDSAEATRLPDDAEALRREAVASLERKRKFGRDLLAYMAVNGVLWLIWVVTDRTSDGSMPWPAWVSAIWGFFLVLDAWRAFARWPRSLFTPTTEAEIQREMRRLRPGD